MREYIDIYIALLLTFSWVSLCGIQIILLRIEAKLRKDTPMNNPTPLTAAKEAADAQ
jgi:hypothetical protein